MLGLDIDVTVYSLVFKHSKGFLHVQCFSKAYKNWSKQRTLIGTESWKVETSIRQHQSFLLIKNEERFYLQNATVTVFISQTLKNSD